MVGFSGWLEIFFHGEDWLILGECGRMGGNW